MVLHREKTRTMVLCAMFVVLIAAGAWIKIPVPVVPFTLQYLFTMLAGILLGGRRGALAVCAYLALGLAGLPIFAQGGGLSYLLQPRVTSSDLPQAPLSQGQWPEAGR